MSLPDVLLMIGAGTSCRGFVEFAFSSATPDKKVAVQYSGADACKGPAGCSLSCKHRASAGNAPVNDKKDMRRPTAIAWYVAGREHADGVVFSAKAQADKCWSHARLIAANPLSHDDEIKVQVFAHYTM